MATFSIVMRCLSRGQARRLKQSVLHIHSNIRALSGVHNNRILCPVQIYASSRHKDFVCLFSSTPTLLESQQKQQPPNPPPPVVESSSPSPSSMQNDSSTETTVNISNQQNPDKKDEAGSDDKSSSDKKKDAWWRGKNSWRLGLIFIGGALTAWGVGLVSIWGAPQLDPDGKEIEDEFSEMPSIIAHLRRTWKEMNIFKQKIQDPSREKLLPDPLKYPYIQPPYTLVIELTGVLIHPDWTYSTGWRFKKRPGIEYFLQQVGPPLYEVVIYSSESGMTADPLVNHLDPQGYVMYRLYRDATRYMNGHHVKDLSCLNRDMSRIIMLDCNPESVKLQPQNSLVLKKWTGEDNDRTLIDLAHFLKTIAVSGVDDIRAVLEYYSQFDDPLSAFKDNQRRLQEEEEARAKLAKEESKKKSWLSGFTSRR